MAEYTNNIKGWMGKEELQFLYDRAGEMSDIVEIGSYLGRSTHALLSGCNGKVIAIDTWKGGKLIPMDGTEYDKFLENIKGVGQLTTIIGDSVEISKTIEPVDMVFLDGDHTYDGVKRDIEAWLPKAKKLICGHDHDPEFPGVIKAVSELIGEVDVIDSIWFKWIK